MKIGGDPRHVRATAPTRQVVSIKPRESATRYNHLEPRFHKRRKDGIVATQRMPDYSDAIPIDLGQRDEQVDRPLIVPNRLESPAGKLGIGGEVVYMLP